MSIRKHGIAIHTCVLGTRGVGMTTLISKLRFDEDELEPSASDNPFHTVILNTTKANYKLKIFELNCKRLKENIYLVNDYQLFLLVFDLLNL